MLKGAKNTGVCGQSMTLYLRSLDDLNLLGVCQTGPRRAARTRRRMAGYGVVTAVKRGELALLGKQELVSWVNRALRTDYTRVEDCSDGVAFAQLLDAVLPAGAVPLHRLNFSPVHEHDRERNLAVVRATLDKLDVRVPMDVPGIARGKFRACDDFLRWTFAVVHRNRPGVAHGEYDAYARRVEAQEKRRAIALRGSASGWSFARGDLRASATSGRAIANRHQLERHRAAASAAAAAPTSTPLPSGVPPRRPGTASTRASASWVGVGSKHVNVGGAAGGWRPNLHLRASAPTRPADDHRRRSGGARVRPRPSRPPELIVDDDEWGWGAVEYSPRMSVESWGATGWAETKVEIEDGDRNGDGDGDENGDGDGGSARFESRARLDRPSTAPVRGGGSARDVASSSAWRPRQRGLDRWAEKARAKRAAAQTDAARRDRDGETRARPSPPRSPGEATPGDATSGDGTPGDVTSSARIRNLNRAERPARTLRDDDPFASTGPIEAPFEEEEEGEDPWDVRAFDRASKDAADDAADEEADAWTQSPPGSAERASRLRRARLLARREREAFARGETSPSFLSSPRAVAAGRAAATTAEEEREKAANARRRERVMESTRRELREIKAREAARRREKEERQRRERRGTPCGAAGEVTRDVSIAGWGADESAPAAAFSASAFSASGTPRATRQKRADLESLVEYLKWELAGELKAYNRLREEVREMTEERDRAARALGLAEARRMVGEGNHQSRRGSEDDVGGARRGGR